MKTKLFNPTDQMIQLSEDPPVFLEGGAISEQEFDPTSELIAPQLAVDRLVSIATNEDIAKEIARREAAADKKDEVA